MDKIETPLVQVQRTKPTASETFECRCGSIGQQQRRTILTGITLDELLQEEPNILARQNVEELHYVQVKVEQMKKRVVE